MPGSFSVGSSSGGYSGGGTDGFGVGTSYNPLNRGPPGPGGGSRPVPAAWTPVPTPPAAIIDPNTGRETPDASIEFQTFDGYTGAVGTPRQLLDQLPALLKYNDSRSKNTTGNLTPVLKLSGGYPLRFDNVFVVMAYLTRSAAPTPAPPPPAPPPPSVPDSTLAALFQSSLGRATWPEEVARLHSMLASGQSLDAVRTSLATSQEAHDKVAAAFKAELGRDAPEANVSDLQRGILSVPGGSLDGVRAFLAGMHGGKGDHHRTCRGADQGGCCRQTNRPARAWCWPPARLTHH